MKNKNKGIAAVIAAGGLGRRFGGHKQMENLKGRPLLHWSLEAFQKHPEVDEIILVLKREYIPGFNRDPYPKLKAVVPGGSTRQESVAAGFSVLNPIELVLIHDSARPLIGAGLISRVIAGVRKSGAAVPGIGLEDTLKEADETGIVKTVDRNRYIRAQTPQGFNYYILKAALENAYKQEYWGTDEAYLVERLGRKIAVVPGERKNIKITLPWDIQLAEVLIELPDRNRI